jgi:exodeoxyribonuclease VII small subunit
MSEKNKQFEENSLEENFALLDELIDRLEEDDLPLEQAFGAYSEGMKILKVCNSQIDRVEKQLITLNEAGEIED